MIDRDFSPKQPNSIDEWSEMLRVRELPIFSNTAHRIYKSLDDTKIGAMELASVILQDPNLTAKLLKVSNSPYYNPSKQKMSTISRAIIVLGAEVIRELTLACSFFESILSSSNKERANMEIAHAIHAAVQARELAILMRDELPEEVFIAALLHNIGHIAFWCSDTKQASLIKDLIEKKKLSPQNAEKQVLGFTLQELSKKLSKFWHFGGLIEESFDYAKSRNHRTQLVLLGGEISESLKFGWESDAMQNCLQKLEKLSGENTKSITEKIKKNTIHAIKIARQFGAHDASKFIAGENEVAMDEDVDTQKLDKKQIQFQILQDISNHISGNINLTRLFEMVLEGIHRGVEMDRTLFLLLSTDKKSLNEKFSFGWENRAKEEKIHFLANQTERNLFFFALSQEEGLWIIPEQHLNLYNQEIITHIGKFECFIFPIYVESKPIGLIYSDRAVHKQPFTQMDFTTSKHFARQASIGLTLFTIKRA